MQSESRWRIQEWCTRQRTRPLTDRPQHRFCSMGIFERDRRHRDFLCHDSKGCVILPTANVDSVPSRPIISIPTTMSG